MSLSLFVMSFLKYHLQRCLIFGVFLGVAYILPYWPFQLILVFVGIVFFCATISHPDMAFKRIMLALAGLGITYLGLFNLLGDITGLPEILAQIASVLAGLGPWVGFALLAFSAVFGILEIGRLWALGRKTDKNEFPRFQLLTPDRRKVSDGIEEISFTLEIENATTRNFTFTELRMVSATLWSRFDPMAEGIRNGTGLNKHVSEEIDLSKGLSVKTGETQTYLLSALIPRGKFETAVRAVLRPIPFLNTALRYAGVSCQVRDSGNKKTVLDDFILQEK